MYSTHEVCAFTGLFLANFYSIPIQSIQFEERFLVLTRIVWGFNPNSHRVGHIGHALL
jgi:hypothetical protein